MRLLLIESRGKHSKRSDGRFHQDGGISSLPSLMLVLFFWARLQDGPPKDACLDWFEAGQTCNLSVHALDVSCQLAGGAAARTAGNRHEASAGWDLGSKVSLRRLLFKWLGDSKLQRKRHRRPERIGRPMHA